MSRDRTDMTASRFPISLFPGVLWPSLPVVRRPVRLTSEGFLAWSEPMTWQPLPDELAIRELLEVDAGSASEVLAFLSQHGAIARRHPNVRRSRPDGTAHWTDAAAYLWDAQQLARTVVAWADDDYIAPVWYADGRWSRQDEEDALLAFLGSLNEGLAHLRPYATMSVDLGALGGRQDVGEPQDVGLFTALVVQVHNMLVEGLPIHRCELSDCGRRFIRQRGGAKHGQHHMKGVRYCSPQCARRAANRAYRRRNKEAGR